MFPPCLLVLSRARSTFIASLLAKGFRSTLLTGDQSRLKPLPSEDAFIVQLCFLIKFFYIGQLSDVLRLKQETGHMTAILTQLHSFVKSIASVTERLAPK